MATSLTNAMAPKDKSGGAQKRRTAARWLKPVVFVACMLPLCYLLWLVVSGGAGANPIEFIEQNSGEWSLRFLLLSLCMTPLAEISKSLQPIKVRRMIGLFAFFYVFLHVLAYAVLDQQLNMQDIVEDVFKRPFITAGFFAFLLLIPLAITSNRFMVTKLKSRWKPLHRVVYIASVAAILHYIWLAKGERIEPLVYLMVLLVLLGYRVRKLRRTGCTIDTHESRYRPSAGNIVLNLGSDL